jgi:hypothetical protein
MEVDRSFRLSISFIIAFGWALCTPSVEYIVCVGGYCVSCIMYEIQDRHKFIIEG